MRRCLQDWVCIVLLAGCAGSSNDSSGVLHGLGRSRTANSVTKREQEGKPRLRDNSEFIHPWNAPEIRIGLDVMMCRELRKDWLETPAAEFLRLHPYKTLLSFVNASNSIVWSVRGMSSEPYPRYQVAVFSDNRRTNLIDLIEVNNLTKYPLVMGEYLKNMLSIRRGMKMQQVYDLIGMDYCSYKTSTEGKWTVIFNYRSIGGEMFSIIADAATGVVLYAGPTTI